MKPKIKMLIFSLCIGAFACLMSCEKDDDDGGSGGSDPNEFCDQNLCATSDALKQQCIDAYNTCMAGSPESKNDECVGVALIICGL